MTKIEPVKKGQQIPRKLKPLGPMLLRLRVHVNLCILHVIYVLQVIMVMGNVSQTPSDVTTVELSP